MDKIGRLFIVPDDVLFVFAGHYSILIMGALKTVC